MAAKWKAVGQALRLKLGELDTIAASHPRNAEECLNEMLTQWLRRNYNVKRFGGAKLEEAGGGGGRPSWWRQPCFG